MQMATRHQYYNLDSVAHNSISTYTCTVIPQQPTRTITMAAEDGPRLPIANRSKALPASEGAKKIGQQDRINQSGKLYRVASDQVLRMPAVYHLRHNMVQNSFATGSLVDVLCGVCVYYYYNCGGPASDRRACSHRFWSSYPSRVTYHSV